ncbi:transposase [Actinoplanes sp. NPDC051861]|uniref:transposase n=1 Tax=Actinoplanes sp. NPDC051861 TaxID=3155170 RepID=UPI00342A3EF9
MPWILPRWRRRRIRRARPKVWTPSWSAGWSSRPALTAVELVRSFADMMTHLHGERLTARITAAEQAALPGISRFATRLTADLAAVNAGLSLPFSSGPVEGNVNRIKMIKRQMYGRAGFDLLRKRVLLTR